MSTATAQRSFRRRSAGQPPPRPRQKIARTWTQYVAVSPYYLLYLVFGLIPIGFSAYLAFHRWDGLNPITYAGFDQFRFLAEDSTFRLAVVNTLIIWVLSTVPMLLMSLVLASLLNSVRRFATFYQVVLFLPSVTSIVAVTIIFKAIFDNDYGVANDLFAAIGLPEVRWFSGYWTIKILVSMLLTWQWVGYNAIIYYAGLQAISTDVYEAAKVDGAGAVRIFWSITVPLLRPVILFTVIISTITGLQTFTEPQVLFGKNTAGNGTAGGPGQAGLTMVLYFYQQAFVNNNYGYGAAMAYVIFAIVAVFALVNWRLVVRSEK